MLMSAAEIKTQIGQYLQKVEDEHFLKVVHSMLATYVEGAKDPIIGYELDGTPILASEAKAELIADVEAAKNGAYITLEDLKKEAKEW